MKWTDWIDSRTSLRTLARKLLCTPIPGGARWRYVWGGTVVFLFAVQVLTGLLLMAVYSPSATTAWGSVWYIQTQVPFGWLIRGLHTTASDAMLIVVALYCLQIVIAKAYRAPREFVWCLTLCLLGLTLALSLTGHLLPWDQEGYWGTKVRTNILAQTPFVGTALRNALVGGSEFGNLTLTHFYTLHVMVLPALAAVIVWWRALLSRRARDVIAAAGNEDRKEPYWPAQFFRDTLFLYQWLKYFSGHSAEVVGAIVVPGLVILVFLGFPFLDRLMQPRMAHGFVIGVTGIVVLGAGWLSVAAVSADHDPSDERVRAIQLKQANGKVLTDTDEVVLRAREFNRLRERARRLAERALTLAAEHGIPPAGPLELLANDPITRGPALFAANCAVCHRFNGHDGLGNEPSEPATSSDLAGYATRTWVRRLLNDPMDDRHFGLMVKPDGEPAHTRMSRWIRGVLRDNEKDEDRRTLFQNFDAVAAYLEDESLHPGRLEQILPGQNGAVGDGLSSLSSDRLESPSHMDADETLIRDGRRFFMAVCNECHSYNGERSGTLNAPEMLGYGSVPWIELMIAEPSHQTRYRSRGREPAQMPGFRDRLSDRDRRLIAEWLHIARTISPTTYQTSQIFPRRR